MEWIEAVIETVTEGVEAVTGVLIENGINGIQVEDDYEFKLFLENNPGHWDYADEELMNKEKGAAYVKFYVPRESGGETLILIRNAIQNLAGMDLDFDRGTLVMTVSNVDDKDWLDNWKKYYKPFQVGEHIIIKPIWEEYDAADGEMVFNINPGHVFGTGLHQSTKLCIEQLEKRLCKGDTVIDLGCGSGILSVIALMLGAKSAYAIDIDPEAVHIAYENAEMNGIGKENYTVAAGNILSDEKLLEDIAAKRYDIVVANIIADIVIAFSPLVPRFIKMGGLFVTGGIIRERADETAEAIARNGFAILEITSRDEWVSITAQRVE